MISAQEVKKLRDETGASMMQCKKALEESKGNFDAAIKIMQKNGAKIAAKKGDRNTAEGVVGAYIHSDGKSGVMVEINCETDFVAKGEEFKSFARDIAMHIMAMNPKYVSVEEIDEAMKEQIRQEVVEGSQAENKPADIMAKIVEGRVSKAFEEVSLLSQPFVKDPNMTVGDLLHSKVAKFGENVKIKRFVRIDVK